MVQGEKIWGSRLKKRRGQKAKGSRIQGFEGSSGSLGIYFKTYKPEKQDKLRNQRNRIEGWKVGGLAKNQEAKGSRGQVKNVIHGEKSNS